MKRRLSLIIVAMSGTVSGSEVELLRESVDAFYQAGNYTWSEYSEGERRHGPRVRPVPRAHGETVIGGYTIMTASRAERVLFGNEMAFRMGTEWRHAHDLTPADVLRLKGESGMAESHLKEVRDLPHEILRNLLRIARNVRRVPGGVGADLDPNIVILESYVRSGRGWHIAALRRGNERQGAYPEVMLTVIIANKLVTGFLVEFWSTGTDLTDPGRPVAVRRVREHRTEFSQIGKTVVKVAPEAAALFVR